MGYNGVICYPSFNNLSIEACPQSRIEKLSESIDSLNPFEEKRDIFATSVLSDSVNVQFDAEGRVSIPDKLLGHAKIKQTMLFVGQGKTFQIWEPKLFEKFKTQVRKKANLNRASLKWETQFSKEGR
jgi:MraZ protein